MPVLEPICPVAQLPHHLFYSLVEHAPLGISITDAHARILYVNPAFSQITGYAASEVLGCNPSLLSYKVTPPEVYADLWAHISAGQPWQGRMVNRRRDGSRYLADLSITPILDDKGAVTFYLGIQRDVTELHALSEKLKNQKKLIENIIDLAPVAVALLDAREQMLLDNQEYKKLMGSFGREEPAHAVLTTLRAELGEAAWAAIEHAGEFSEQTLRFDRPGAAGPAWYAVSGSWFTQADPSVDGFFTTLEQRYLLLVLTDVTRLKQQQQAQWLQALRTMLSEGELVARLRETLAGAAFQLAGPLNLIQAVEGRLALRLPEGDAALSALHTAREQGQAALTLLQTAMPSSPPEAWLPLNCNELLHDVLNLLTERLLAEGVIVDWTPAARLPLVQGQAIALRGVLKQVLSNALDALHETRPARREIRLASRVADEGIELEICDSGPGIPEPLRIKVFEPFFTTRPGGARAGMGLTLAQEVLQRHQGSLEIDPLYHAGCRIVIRLPVLREVEYA